MKKCCLFLVLATFAGCFQAFNEDEELRTVPVTNNPHIIPNCGSPFPGVGESAPY